MKDAIVAEEIIKYLIAKLYESFSLKALSISNIKNTVKDLILANQIMYVFVRLYCHC